MHTLPVDAFLEREYKLAMQDTSSRLQANATWNHFTSWENFKESLELNVSAHPDRITIGGLLILATNATTGRVVGMSTALLSKTGETLKVGDNYVGISSRDAGGYGLGGTLVLLRDYVLTQKGVTSYDAYVWPGSHRMYDRIGATYQATGTPSRPYAAPEANMHLTVTLDQDQLERQCTDQLHIDLSTDILHTPTNVGLRARRVGVCALADALETA